MIDDLLKKIDKKYLYIAGGVILFLLILLGLASCGNSSNNGTAGFKKDNFKEIEKTMISAAKDYYSEYPRYLPKENSSKRVKVNTLVNKGYMKDLDEFTSDKVTCKGEVLVNNFNNEYSYTAYLDCGKAYSSITLYDYILNNQKIYEEDDPSAIYSEEFYREGLYKSKVTNEYYYRGDVKNNYLKIGDNLWRIVSIDENNYITIIYSGNNNYNGYWDNTYNSDTLTTEGINDFNLSVLRRKLNEVLDNNKIIPANLKKKLVYNSWCIGKRSNTESKMDGTIECSTLSEKSYVGTLAAYQYLRVSLDRNCATTLSRQCSNYNYLKDKIFWTLTGDTSATNMVYYVVDSLQSTKANSTTNYRYVLLLNDSVIVKSDTNGTIDKPFEIVLDK